MFLKVKAIVSRILKSEYVTGLLLCGSGVDVITKPLNHTMVFVKDTDVVLTSDHWRVVVNFDLTAYEDAVTILLEYLAGANEIASRTTPVGELQHVESALSSLENKLANLKRFLPKVDRRRRLINAGGSTSKVTFGTTTVLDLDELHTIVDELHRKEDTIVHSVNQQVTYPKQLDRTVYFNHQDIVNLSTTLKESAVKAQERFPEVATKLEWGVKQREAATTIRELEFAFTQLEVSNDEFMDSMQYLLIGKVPVNLISPTVFQEILKNVSLILLKAMN